MPHIRIAIDSELTINDLHIAFQSQPFYRAKWAISSCNMGDIRR